MNWDGALRYLDSTEATDWFTSKLLSIVSTHIPNFEILCDAKDPPWITRRVKNAIHWKHKIYKKYVDNGRNPREWRIVKSVRNETTRVIEKAKEDYFRGLGEKLCDPSKGTKVYWETINKILNRKKVTCIPPLIENDVVYTSFLKKADIFNEYFVKQCSLLVNDSSLPDSLPYRTTSRLENVEISEEKIVRIINELNPNKTHGCDKISIHMLQLCARECSKPLKMLFEKCLQSGHYAAIWKKANVVPVHKKGNRQLKTNYRPISLLPICGKIFEKIIFD